MRKSLVGILAFSVFLSLAPKADAALILAVDSNGSQACAADNNLGCGFGTILPDLDPTLGTISLGTTVLGGVQVEGSFHTAGTAGGNVLTSSSLAIINLLATTAVVQASVSATNFLGPTSFAAATGSGTWINSGGSSTTYTYYNSLLNQQGATTATNRPGTLVASFTDVSTGGPLDSFSFDSGNLPFVDPGLFSMTLGFDLNLLGGDRLDSRGQALFKDQVSEVPEPMSMILLGTGLIGGAAKLRRRKNVA